MMVIQIGIQLSERHRHSHIDACYMSDTRAGRPSQAIRAIWPIDLFGIFHDGTATTSLLLIFWIPA